MAKDQTNEPIKNKKITKHMRRVAAMQARRNDGYQAIKGGSGYHKPGSENLR